MFKTLPFTPAWPQAKRAQAVLEPQPVTIPPPSAGSAASLIPIHQSIDEAHPQSRLPRRRSRHPVSARHQGDAEGDADRRRPPGRPARGRRGARGRDRAFHFRHRAQQGRDRGPFRHRLRARRARSPSAARRRSWRSSARQLPGAGQTSFTRQQAPLGLGHAVWCAREIVGDEPFALLLPDMLHHGPILPRPDDRGLRAAPAATSSRSTRCRTARPINTASSASDAGETCASPAMVEKPKAGTAPSNLAISGRYILQPEIFDLLERQERGAGGEIQITDAMIKLSETQAFPCRPLRRHDLRLRLEARLPDGEPRLRLGPGGAGSPVAGGVDEVARAITAAKAGSAARPDRCWRCSRSCGRCSSDARG